MSETSQEILRVLATNPIRCINSTLQKGAYLVAELKFGLRPVARVLHLGRTSLRRAVHSYHDMRPIGRVGRPPKTTQEQREKLKSVLDKRIKQHQSPTKRELAGEVRWFFLSHSWVFIYSDIQRILDE